LKGIFNFIPFSKYLALICAERDNNVIDPPLDTCETFHSDSKIPSSEKSLYFFIKINNFGSFRIHCREVSETLLASQDENPAV